MPNHNSPVDINDPFPHSPQIPFAAGAPVSANFLCNAATRGHVPQADVPSFGTGDLGLFVAECFLQTFLQDKDLRRRNVDDSLYYSHGTGLNIT